ncbi:MAG TPA: ArsI/CadI family heavy metal resistance metalloenzyme [Pyrinomonadaceae bacterium]|nr:ArsI/CadI family heavy metal resistance metalloenzyme [Pyrinomonadaceae bacterium]
MKTHISINVSDVEKSIEFYTKMFGVEPFKTRKDYAKFDLANPPLNFTMNQRPFTEGGSLSHLGLQVESTEEVLEMGKRWQESGLITLDEMKTDCCYALQDKTWVQDPDGNRWEVFVVLGNTEDKDIAASACCAPSNEKVGITRASKSGCC